VERRISRRSGLNYQVEHMFLGQYHHTIDDKGRLTIPSRFRESLTADGVYITQGFDQNLIVLDIPIFERITNRLNRMSITDPNARMLRRLILSNAELISLDKFGRILLPQFLRDLIRIDSEVVLVGVGDYFELWSPDLWQDHKAVLRETEPSAVRFMDLDLTTSE
jgi:transcriptional regulator MraZ